MTLTNAPTTNANKLAKYFNLEQPEDKIQCTYVWIDGTGECLRHKTRTHPVIPRDPSELPIWIYDGSSAYQANGSKSDVFLNPVAIYRDPITGGNNKLVLCDTYYVNEIPTDTNHRRSCVDVMEKAKSFVPWFGLEQEYTLFDVDGRPFGWPKNGFPDPQGPYYCGTGADKEFGHEVAQAHYRACLYSGITVAGINAEVMPSQWEFQIGTCEGILAGDDLWMARFLLHSVARDFGIVASLDPKPMPGDWNGAGCHANFSTKAMRAENGIVDIEKAIDKLALNHAKHIKAYDPNQGKDNERRLTGRHETSSIHDFSAAVANRGASIRIPQMVANERKDYLEDRRPSSNCDPYSVTEIIVRTTVRFAPV